MKKIIAAAILLINTSVFAQTEKGDWLAGGTIGFRTNKNNSEFNLSPNGGYFFANNFVAGINLQIETSKTGDVKQTTLGTGPFARLYVGKGNFRPFAITSVDYLYKSIKNTTKTTSNGVGWLIGAGGAAFLNSAVALEAIAGYNYTKFSGAGSDNGFSLKFGFQVYINRDKMQSLKRGRIND